MPDDPDDVYEGQIDVTRHWFVLLRQENEKTIATYRTVIEAKSPKEVFALAKQEAAMVGGGGGWQIDIMNRV